MTYSIVAWDAETGATGVAVATKFLAVGALCPFVRAGVGALANQAFVNPSFGPRALALLELQVPVDDVLRLLLTSDESRQFRQLQIVDRLGNTAAFTGDETDGWAGHKTFPHFSVAGNMLVSEATLVAMAETYRQHLPSADLAERLVLALEAGQAAGGDRRGRQSAALLIGAGENYPPIDLRVDDHFDPVAELRRLLDMAKEVYVPLKQFLTASAPTDLDIAAERELVDPHMPPDPKSFPGPSGESPPLTSDK